MHVIVPYALKLMFWSSHEDKFIDLLGYRTSSLFLILLDFPLILFSYFTEGFPLANDHLIIDEKSLCFRLIEARGVWSTHYVPVRDQSMPPPPGKMYSPQNIL